MTKFEKAKIIGMRAVQISKNAPLYLKNENIANMNYDPITIAEKELAEKKIPFIIRRYLPDSSFEDWKISELKTFDWLISIKPNYSFFLLLIACLFIQFKYEL